MVKETFSSHFQLARATATPASAPHARCAGYQPASYSVLRVDKRYLRLLSLARLCRDGNGPCAAPGAVLKLRFPVHEPYKILYRYIKGASVSGWEGAILSYPAIRVLISCTSPMA